MKTLVVTGGTKGIGRAIADKFLSEGFEVAVCARKANEISEMQQLYDAPGTTGRLHTFVCDVADKEQLKAFYDFVHNKMGAIDILVNNAGLFELGNLYDEPEGMLERHIETNLYGAYRLSRLFLQDMIAKKSGHMFNVCSVASQKAYPNCGSYTVSKFALYGMTKALRNEMIPHHIKVTAILPGATFSGSWDGTDLPETRFIQASDVADAVYAASHLSPSAVIEEIVMRPFEGDI